MAHAATGLRLKAGAECAILTPERPGTSSAFGNHDASANRCRVRVRAGGYLPTERSEVTVPSGGWTNNRLFEDENSAAAGRVLPAYV